MSFKEIKNRGIWKTFVMEGTDFSTEGQIVVRKFDKADDEWTVETIVPADLLNDESTGKALEIAAKIFEKRAGTMWENFDARVDYEFTFGGKEVARSCTVHPDNRIIHVEDRIGGFAEAHDAMTFAEMYWANRS